MKFTIVFVCILPLFIASPPPSNIEPIANGHNATPHEAPYYVMLLTKRFSIEYQCGGSLIHPQWVLTAAHCNFVALFNQWPKVKMFAHAGLHNFFFRPYEQVVRVKKSFQHEQYVYHGGGAPFDIALFYLEKPFTLNNYVGHIAVRSSNVKPTGRCVLYGFGEISSHPPARPNFLQTVTTEVISLEKCKNSFPLDVASVLHPSNICTGSGNQHISGCGGDSGGPLVQIVNKIPVLIGVASWATTPCGGFNAPTVYTDVGYFFEWIKSKLDS